MDRQAMIDVAAKAIARQDDGEVGGIVELFAEDVSFMMPVLPEPLRGRDALRENVEETWPEATTGIEWFAVDGNRLVCAWNWRGKGDGWPDDAPLLRGVSTFVFGEDGLVTGYEDWFDPDWMTRHGQGG
jgi:hypothetical protein